MKSCSLLTSVFACVCLLLCSQHAGASLFQEAILQKMERVRQTASADVIPVAGGPLAVSLSLDLGAVRDVDTTRGELEIVAMRDMRWADPAAAWHHGEDSDGGEDVPSVSMATRHLWTPDIVAYNAVNAPELLSPPIAKVRADGQILYIPNERIRFRCDLRSFATPAGSNCTLVYGSWTYDGEVLDLVSGDASGGLSWFEESPGVELLGFRAETEVRHFVCCPAPYPLVKFVLHIRGRAE